MGKRISLETRPISAANDSDEFGLKENKEFGLVYNELITVTTIEETVVDLDLERTKKIYPYNRTRPKFG